MSENAQPVFSIEKLYVKDLSLEVPGAPQIFLEREAPQVNVQLRTEAQNIDEGVYEVVLTVTVSASIGEDRTLFLVEVAQGGIFQIRNVPEADLDGALDLLRAHYPDARRVGIVTGHAGVVTRG